VSNHLYHTLCHQFGEEITHEVLTRMLALSYWPHQPLRYARRAAWNLKVSAWRRQRILLLRIEVIQWPEQERRAIARQALARLPVAVVEAAMWEDTLTPTQRTQRRRAVKRRVGV